MTKIKSCGICGVLDSYNDQDDNNAELSKLCDIYGKGYELYYVDEQANIGITYVSPMEAFLFMMIPCWSVQDAL